MITESLTRRMPGSRRVQTDAGNRRSPRNRLGPRRARVIALRTARVFSCLAASLTAASVLAASASGQTRPAKFLPFPHLKPAAALAQAPSPPGKKPERPKSAAPDGSKAGVGGEPKTLKLSLAAGVRLGLARNFSIRLEQLNPRILAQDVKREEAAFDVVGFGGGTISESFSPSNSSLASVRRSESDSRSVNAGVRRRYRTGTDYEITTGLERRRNNAGFVQFDPAVEPTFSLSVTQNLLKNFGRRTNTTAIRVARNNRRISSSVFRDGVINVVSDIENFYSELIFAIQDLEVKKKSLALARNLLRRNRIQVEVGTLAPIEIIQAEASVATREADVITAERQVRDNDDLLKRALNLPKNFRAWDVRILPTDTPSVIRRAPDVRKSYGMALKDRPDYAQAKLDIENKNIQVKFAKNQLLPTLDLTGSIALNGLSDEFGEAVDDFGRGEFYQWAVGFKVEFPLRNRAAKSTLTRRKLETAQALLSLKNLEQQILLEVREAVRGILTAQKRVTATRAARALTERQLDAEEKKFAVGLSTSFKVLEFQEDLATARSTETRAIIDQIKALVTFRRFTGQTLAHYRVRLESVGKGR
ncbi:MAG: TolC family protein [Nitrospinota bacterium]|nr:TolC family protein [Nitrospinota bacterium]